MHTETWGIMIAALTTALGGSVSAHGPTDRRHKFLWFGAFVGLGILQGWVLVKQSGQNAATSRDLENNLHRLTDLTQEVHRIQKLNTDLENRILALTETISDLSKQNLASVTG